VETLTKGGSPMVRFEESRELRGPGLRREKKYRKRQRNPREGGVSQLGEEGRDKWFKLFWGLHLEGTKKKRLYWGRMDP